MVQIIPRGKTFSSELGLNVGGGASKGFSDSLQGQQQEKLATLKERMKAEAKEKNLKEISDLLRQSKKPSEKSPIAKIDDEVEEMESEEPIDFEEIPDETIAEITIKDPVIGKALLEGKKSKLKEKERNQTNFQKERERHEKVSDPILADAGKILENAPARKGLMRQWRQDVESGNTSGFGQFMVDKSGLEFWRTPESARSLAAGKHYFMDTIHSLGSGIRLNQFLEKNLYAALPQIGRDKEAQLSVLDMQEFLDDLKEEKAKIKIRLGEEDVEKEGYAKRDIDQRAQQELEEYANERQQKLAFDIRKTHEDLRSDKDLINEISSGKIPKGAPITPRMIAILKLISNDDTDKAIKKAIELGFELPRRKK